MTATIFMAEQHVRREEFHHNEAQVQRHRKATRNKMSELRNALLIEIRRKKKCFSI